MKTVACDFCGKLHQRKNFVANLPHMYCSYKCMGMANRASIADFWTKVNRQGPDECWEWQGTCTLEGYGDAYCQGRRMSAHRLAYTLAKGKIPAGMMVMHSCDNKKCCNPAHLSPGTGTDNIRDAAHKGLMPHGPRHWHTKLTDEQVAAIAVDARPAQEVADFYKITKNYVHMIRRGDVVRKVYPARTSTRPDGPAGRPAALLGEAAAGLNFNPPLIRAKHEGVEAWQSEPPQT